MDTKNRTLATEFILLGFSNDFKINIVLFVLFLLIYLIAANANAFIIFMIINNPQLHIPMYFFLCILSFLDLCFVTTVVPRMLADLVSFHRSISYSACSAQFHTILLVAGTEYHLLALMAYDRYAAICHPLLYPVLMRWSVCYRLTAFIWILSFMMFIVPSFASPMALCYPNQVNHFMCDVVAVIQLACDDYIQSSDIMIFMLCFIGVLMPFILIIVSYVCIISSVMKIQAAGRSKAFSTCSSHVTVVALYFGVTIITYFGSSTQYSKTQGKYIELFTSILCPTLNPFIYSLNNKDVKNMQRKFWSKFAICHSV